MSAGGNAKGGRDKTWSAGLQSDLSARKMELGKHLKFVVRLILATNKEERNSWGSEAVKKKNESVWQNRKDSGWKFEKSEVLSD